VQTLLYDIPFARGFTACRRKRSQLPYGNLPGDQETWTRWFNTATFVQGPFGRFGTAPRSRAVRLPGIENFDFSVNKAVRFQEEKAFEFRAEFFNLLKHYNPDPATVDLNIRSATYGMIGGRRARHHHPRNSVRREAGTLIAG
jgi:hypothetical protein